MPVDRTVAGDAEPVTDEPREAVCATGPATAADCPPGVQVPPDRPPASGGARELSRRRSTRRRYVDTGRRHHLGAAPELLPVYGEDGAITGTTRTSAHQLASLTAHQLAALAATVTAEMAAAAATQEYETAQRCLDEVAAVRAEIARRTPR